MLLSLLLSVLFFLNDLSSPFFILFILNVLLILLEPLAFNLTSASTHLKKATISHLALLLVTLFNHKFI